LKLINTNCEKYSNETDVYVKFVSKELRNIGQNGITLMYKKPNKKNYRHQIALIN